MRCYTKRHTRWSEETQLFTSNLQNSSLQTFGSSSLQSEDSLSPLPLLSQGHLPGFCF
ncbi:hypothetical protein FKM82_016874 [Ascaphus truei]